MQILSTLDLNNGENKRFESYKAEVKPMIVDAKVPHMGFNNIEVVKSNQLLKGFRNEEFYFMHSFEVVNYTEMISLTEYAEHLFVSSIQKRQYLRCSIPSRNQSRKAGINCLKFHRFGVIESLIRYSK